MDMLRCPACDGVLKPFERDQQEVLGCESCGRCYSPDYLEELDGWYEQGASIPSQRHQLVSIETPNIARRLQAATKLSESQRLRGLFVRGWSSVFVFFTLAGLLQWADTRDWKTLLAFIGLGAVIGVASGLIWLCFFLRPEQHPLSEDMTAGEAIEQLRQHNREILGRETDKVISPSAPEDTPTAQDAAREMLTAARTIRPSEPEERASNLVTPKLASRAPFVLKPRSDSRTKTMKLAFWCGWVGVMAIASATAAAILGRPGGDMGEAVTILSLGAATGPVVGVLMMILVGGLTSLSHASDETTEDEVPTEQLKADPSDAGPDRAPAPAIPNPSEQASEAIQKPPEEIQR